MSSASAEVSKKIRAAIKAKLEELGVYVDEELPDYIMVMIANKKEKSQMKEDLLLFLGKNSAKFVDWLFEIFDRLQTASVAGCASSASEPAATASSAQGKKKEQSGGHKKGKKEHEEDKKRDRKRTSSGDKHKEKAAERRKEKEAEKEAEKREKEAERREKDREAERREREKEAERKEREKEAERREREKEREREREKEREKEAERREREREAERREKEKKEAERREKEKEVERKKEAERLEREAEKEREVERRRKEEAERREREREAELREKRPEAQRSHKPIEYISDESTRRSRRAEEKVVLSAGKGSARVNSKEKAAEADDRLIREARPGQRAELKRRKDPKEQDSSPVSAKTKPHAEERIVEAVSPRKRKSSPLPEVQIVDSDEEERLAEEESAMLLRSKKVQSSAVMKMAQTTSAKTVPSQVIVKRKLPDKENTKQSQGAKSLFLKAIKEAGEMTRTASQSAGYGGGAAATTRGKKGDGAQSAANQDSALTADDEIDANDEDDLEDALVVMPSAASGGGMGTVRAVRTADEDPRQDSDTAAPAKPKRMRITAPSDTAEEPKFVITVKGGGPSSHTTRIVGERDEPTATNEKSRKRRADVNPILAHLNTQPRSERVKKGAAGGDTATTRPPKHEAVANGGRATVDAECDDAQGVYDTGIASEASNDSRRTPVWDGQIQLGEDSSDDEGDNEAQIDAVLASTNSVVVGYDDEIPPTPSLTKPDFFLPQVQAQSALLAAPRQNVYSVQNKVVRQASVPSVSTPITGEKLMERCKFWPGCRLGENCVYIHPSKPCGNFPNCAFADKCFYVHPTCKFDKACTNPRCPYAHSLRLTPTPTPSGPPATATTSSGPAPGPTIPLSVQAPSPNAGVPCRFGGKCANSNCPFKHPKMCRFGERCTNRGCYFRHPRPLIPTSMPPVGGRFKWKKSPTSA